MSAVAIDPRTRPGAVALTVRDLARVRGFYERTLGLRALDSDDAGARLGPAGGDVLVELVADPDAPARPPRTTGLFHLAILVPDRRELARSLRRLLAAGARLAGASDHLVSEALYLADPEGNGIEIYSDRPRAGWRRDRGEILMATLPLDLEALLAEADGGGPEAPVQTRVGHVHLDVSDLGAAEAFYAGPLGLEVTVRSYPGALFAAAGGYHHHVGLNTWRAAGAPSPPAGAAGLRAFELVVPDAGELDRVEARLRAAGVPAERDARELRAADPSGNAVRLRVDAEPAGT